MAERSEELIKVGYYLSRFGKSNPPPKLGVTKWKDAYKLFYKSLSDGRSFSEFEHSLKNSRDAFDGYFSKTEREGWKGDDGLPSKLTGFSLSIFNEFNSLDENDVYLKITKFISSESVSSNSRFNNLDLLNKAFAYSWLYSLTADQWNKLLDTTKTTLENIVDDKDDSRLVISLRNDNKKRLAVIFGQKYVGGFYLEKAKPVVRFYIDADFDIKEDSRFSDDDWEFADQKGKLIYCDLDKWQGQDDPLINRIRKNLSELFINSGKSGFKRNHLSFLYDVIIDSTTRKQFTDFIQLSPQLRLLETYRQYLILTQNNDELYKWEIAKKFKDNWNLEAIDFGEMLSSIKFSNLLSQQSTSFYNLARKNPEDARQYFNFIFNESISIETRIKEANVKGVELMKKWHPTWTTAGQDERTLSVFWAFNDLNNHAPYKSSFYTKYCDFIGVKPESPGAKYQDYLRLLNEFIQDYIDKDEALIQLHDSFLNNLKHISDPSHKLMAQNILYRILDGYWNTEIEEELIDTDIEVNEEKNTMDINLKEQFAEWFAVQDTKYFKNLFNSDKNRFIQKLGEYELAYEKDFSISIFSLLNNTLEQILEALNTNEIVEPGEMFALSSKLGNHAPKAILGKKNYIRFIEELIKNKSMSSIRKKVDVGPLNTILYGPPGTGKTYNTVNKALELIGENIEGLKRPEIVDLFKKKINEGQIVFTSFHQSFSYEDFIEGIKPLLETTENSINGEIKYVIENGVFKDLVERINNAQEFVESGQKHITIDPEKFKNNINKVSLGNSLDSKDDIIYDYCMSHDCIVIGFGEDIDFTGVKNRFDIRKRFQDNGIEFSTSMDFNISAIERLVLWMEVGQLVFVSDGMSKLKAIGEVSGDYYCDPSSPIRYTQFRKVKWLYKDLSLPIEEIYGKKFSQQTIYQIDPKQINQAFFTSQSSKNENGDNYVLIIDEINRGNVSAIFGELITLIESDKRKGSSEELSLVLPYSKKPFSVPNNLFILGTMNTADRSVEALDTALRRRFSFSEMLPKPELIQTEGPLKSTNGVLNGIDLALLLKTINKRIEKLLDKDHQIGHSYFLKVDSLESLKTAFHNTIIPLLQEYFFGDYGKIGLVLGQGFFEALESSEDETFFAEFKDYEIDGILDKRVYHIKDVTKLDDGAFIEIVKAILPRA